MNSKNKFNKYQLSISLFIFILFSFVCIVYSNTAYSQKQVSDTMVQWSPVPLKPSDFTIIPDTSSNPFHAYAATKFFYLKKNVKKQGKEYLDVIIINNFWKTKSYMKKSYIFDTLLLRHEQGHFDISEIFARRLIKKLSSVSLPSDYMQELFRLGDENKTLLEQAHLDYDRETNHGSNLFVQKIWNRKIRDELKELEKYSSKQALLKLNIN